MSGKIFTIAAAVLLASCAGQQTDPVEEALRQEICFNMPQAFNNVSFATIELVDSTTFGQELDKRVKLFELKAKVEAEYAESYLAQGKRKNAEVKTESVKYCQEVLAALDSLRGALGSRIDDVAYYDYVFSARAAGKDGNMEFNQSWASITPSYEVIGLASKQADVHKGLGKVIPGYLDIVKVDSE